MTQIKPYKNKDNVTRYYFNAYVGRNPKTGKNVYRKRQGFKTKKQAQIALAELLKDIDENGLEDKPKKEMTFKELYEMWLKQHRMNVRESTLETLKNFVTNHILPNFEHLLLSDISVVYCQKVVNSWYEQGLKSYSRLRTITIQIMRYGESMELMKSNPMSKTIFQRKQEEESSLKYFTKDQLEKFFKCLEKNNDFKQLTFFRLLAFTGARKGEILALQWKNVDLKNKSLTIGQTLARGEKGKRIIQKTKTLSGKRAISLDDETIKILTKWRSFQRQDFFKMGYNTTGENQYVFTNNMNELHHLHTVNYWLSQIIKNHDLPEITPHHFRHTHASLLLQAGVPVKEVSERLGHKDIKITLEIYSHVMPEEAEKTAAKFANFVGF